MSMCPRCTGSNEPGYTAIRRPCACPTPAEASMLSCRTGSRSLSITPYLASVHPHIFIYPIVPSAALYPRRLLVSSVSACCAPPSFAVVLGGVSHSSDDRSVEVRVDALAPAHDNGRMQSDPPATDLSVPEERRRYEGYMGGWDGRRDA